MSHSMRPTSVRWSLLLPIAFALVAPVTHAAGQTTKPSITGTMGTTITASSPSIIGSDPQPIKWPASVQLTRTIG